MLFDNVTLTKVLLNSVYGAHTNCRKCGRKLNEKIYRIPLPVSPLFWNGFPQDVCEMYPNIIYYPVYLCEECVKDVYKFLGIELPNNKEV